MTNKLASIYSAFMQKPYIWFFYAFLATSTLSIRKVLFFYPINESFNEYTGIYIYLSDIFLLLTLTTWAITLCNKSSFLSILQMFHSRKNVSPARDAIPQALPQKTYQKTQIVPRGTISKNFMAGGRGTFHGAGLKHFSVKSIYQHVIHNYILTFPFFLVIFSFVSILWADNSFVAFYRSIKLFEFFLLFVFVYKLFHACPVASRFVGTASGVEQFGAKNNKKCSTPAPYNVPFVQNNASAGLVQENYMQQQNVPRGTFVLGWNILRVVFLILVVSGLVQGIIGITQFVLQHSIGLLWLGESIVSPSLPGVAKIIFDNHILIRSYGLFPHPNILGGFQVLSILALLSYIKLFHVEQFVSDPKNVPRGTFPLENKGLKINNKKSNLLFYLSKFLSKLSELFHVEQFSKIKINFLSSKESVCTFSDNSRSHGIVTRIFHVCILKCSTWNIFRRDYFRAETVIFYLILIILGLSLSLSFSKSAIIGLFIGLFYLHYIKCSTWNISSASGVEHFYRKIILITCILVFSGLLLKTDRNVLFIKSLSEREFYLNVSRGTFLTHPLIGVGAGQFVPNMIHTTDAQNWQFQPVHNVFLLVLNEYGIFILLAFIFFLFKIFSTKSNCSTPEAIPASWDTTGQAWNKDNQRELFHVYPVASKCSTWNIYSATGVEHFGDLNCIYPYFKAILIALTFISLFDHYPWDIQQGQIMLWIALGVTAAWQKTANLI